MKNKEQKKYYIDVIFFEGISIFSKFIKFFTRSAYSHVGFLLDENKTLEAWKFGGTAYWSITDNFRKYHKEGTKYTVISIPVSKETYNRFLEICNFVNYINIPYDYIGVIAFIFPYKLKINGHWFCSEGVFSILRYLQVLKTDNDEWKISPDILYSIVTTLDGISIRKSSL